MEVTMTTADVRSGTATQVAETRPIGRSYGSHASFSDPDGNGRLLQELTERLPDRV
jgi:hypothetical protein